MKLVDILQEAYPHIDSNFEKYLQEIGFDFVSEDLPKLCTLMKIASDRITEIVITLINFSRLNQA